jgi:hypothetical protein
MGFPRNFYEHIVHAAGQIFLWINYCWSVIYQIFTGQRLSKGRINCSRADSEKIAAFLGERVYAFEATTVEVIPVPAEDRFGAVRAGEAAPVIDFRNIAARDGTQTHQESFDE